MNSIRTRPATPKRPRVWVIDYNINQDAREPLQCPRLSDCSLDTRYDNRNHNSYLQAPPYVCIYKYRCGIRILYERIVISRMQLDLIARVHVIVIQSCVVAQVNEPTLIPWTNIVNMYMVCVGRIFAGFLKVRLTPELIHVEVFH